MSVGRRPRTEDLLGEGTGVVDRRARLRRGRRLHAHGRSPRLRGRRRRRQHAPARPRGLRRGDRRDQDDSRRAGRAGRLRPRAVGHLLEPRGRVLRAHRGRGEGAGLRRRREEGPLRRQLARADHRRHRGRRQDHRREACRRQRLDRSSACTWRDRGSPNSSVLATSPSTGRRRPKRPPPLSNRTRRSRRPLARRCSRWPVGDCTLADVTLPSLGESVTEGIITKWFKKVGDVVARDEPLFEVSTDKVDSEMPSPAAGVLVEILAGEGDTVETGARVAVIDETPGTLTATPTPSEQAAPAPPPVGAQSLSPAPTPPTTAAPATESAGAVVVSPVVRRILSDGGVEATNVQGTGPGGSITRRDAERAVAGSPSEESPVALSNGQRRMGQHMAASSQTLRTASSPLRWTAPSSASSSVSAARRATGEPISDEMVVSLAAVRALGEFDFLTPPSPATSSWSTRA